MIPPRPVRSSMFVIHCKKCGYGKILATFKLSREKQFEIMNHIGWQIAPFFLCRSCACPMDWVQKKRAEEIFEDRKRDGGHLSLYQSQVSAHYPGKEKEIDRWFRTL